MDIPHKKISYEKTFQEKLGYYIEDDQLRLIFIVVLLIGVILLLTGVKEAIIFMLVAFALLAFLCIFKPKPSLREDFICDSFYDIIDEDSMFYKESSGNEESEFGVSIIQNTENRNNKFKNSTRNQK